MTERIPIETKNLDIYGHDPLPWSRPRDLLAAGVFFGRPAFLGTVRPDGRPHSAGIGAIWMDGDIYFTSGPATRKARNLAENPACTISASLARRANLMKASSSGAAALAFVHSAGGRGWQRKGRWTE